MSGEEQSNDVVENIFDEASFLEETEKDKGIGDNILNSDSSYKDDVTSKDEEVQVDKAENSNDTSEKDIENIGEKFWEDRLQDLENQRKKVASKVKELKKFYEEEMKKLNLEDKEITKEVNKIKDEMGVWRLKTWDEVCNDTPLVVKIFLAIGLLGLVGQILCFIVALFSERSYEQVIGAVADVLIGKPYKYCVSAGKCVKDKFSDCVDAGKKFIKGFKAVKSFCSNIGARLKCGYAPVLTEEIY